MGLTERVLFANTRLFAPFIESTLSSANTTDAMLRTTKAPTMLEGAEAENILQQEASFFINFPLHPQDNKATVLAHIDSKISDSHIDVDVLNARSASPVASHENDAFGHLATTARQVFGDVVVAGPTIAGTDSSHYHQYAKDHYRFLPLVFMNEDIALLLGKDERISVENLGKAVQYYELLIQGLQNRKKTVRGRRCGPFSK
ncbi:M20/M25/M40 family metallo-hydrolase [Cognatiyoonia sp.]|uniref:M20/M25/M40 family metallo-hydrolase n=1 Tax=Cognatiyoonia sp. TaxID=2211652 RepID=UPI003F69BCFB